MSHNSPTIGPQRGTTPQRRTENIHIRVTPIEHTGYTIAARLDGRPTAQWARLVLNTAAQLAIDESVDADARTIANARIEP